MKTYLVHAMSGAGKDTQVDLLEDIMDFERISTGRMLREEYTAGTEMGIKANDYTIQGKFVPTELTYKMLEKWLYKFDAEKDWIFISAVRMEDQIKPFDEVLKAHGRQLDHFIHFYLDDDIAIERRTLRRYCETCDKTYHPDYKPSKVEGICDIDGTKLIQRLDDTMEATVSLIEEYKKDIDPIMDEYKKRGIVIDLDGAPGIQEIHVELVKQLGLGQ